ncbi:MAG: hypothetical protein WDO24_22985, partial [Pseudomonadota bacterium]
MRGAIAWGLLLAWAGLSTGQAQSPPSGPFNDWRGDAPGVARPSRRARPAAALRDPLGAELGTRRRGAARCHPE